MHERTTAFVALEGTMAKTKWASFEDQVRDIATHIYGSKCQPERIAGVNFDGVIKQSDHHWVLVEATQNHTLDKVRGDINRLVAARNELWTKGVFCRPYLVMQEAPTQSMKEQGEGGHVTVLDVNSFAAMFIEYERYRLARLQHSFGSAVNPADGTPDQARYIQVNYINKFDKKELSIQTICNILRSGKNVIILGEYGSGKSRCLRQCFETLSADWGATFQFPFAINLRESWGLKTGEEILRRHMDSIGLDDLKPQIVKAYNRRDTLLILDGFDELGIQAWDSDEEKLVQIRATVLQGIKELIRDSRHGVLIAGREHYFSNREEMLNALGCKHNETIIIYAKEEFTEDEMRQYFDETGIDVTLPNWLPRKPLICQTISQLDEEERDTMFGETSSEAKFWEHFVNTLCERDARIHASFSANIIRGILVELSRITRMKPANVGPISQRDLQDAFEKVVGQRPVEEASALLQRLPTLGRVAAETADLQFVDDYILDGLRGTFVGAFSTKDAVAREAIYSQNWTNPLGALGQVILLSIIEDKWIQYLEIAKTCTSKPNKTLGADIISAMARTSRTEADFEGILIDNAAFSEFDLSISKLKNLEISQSTIIELIIPASPPFNVKIDSCAVGKISGISSKSALPAWIKGTDADEYDSVRTISRIRNAGLTAAHETLVGIIKKTFFQPGSGRKEEALSRGFGDGLSRGLAPKILAILVRDDILSRFKGSEGWVYTPVRAQAGRMAQMLEQLTRLIHQKCPEGLAGVA